MSAARTVAGVGGRRERVGSVCGFALPGDGRHKWRPYVWCGGDGVVGRRWWMLGGPSRACWVRLWFRPAGLSWCRCVVGAPFMTPAAARRRQDVGRMGCRGCWACRREVLGPPVVSPCRATGVINGAPTFGVVVTDGWPQVVDVGWAAASVLGSPVVSPCRATGVINGAPTFGVVAMRWLAAGGGCWVSRRGVFCWRACLSCRDVRSCCRGVRRIGCCGGMDKWAVGGGADGGV